MYLFTSVLLPVSSVGAKPTEEEVLTQVEVPADLHTVLLSAHSQAGPGHHLRLSTPTTQNKLVFVRNNVRRAIVAHVIKKLLGVYCSLVGADELEYFGLHRC